MNKFLLKVAILSIPLFGFAEEERYTIIDYKTVNNGFAIVIFDSKDHLFKGFLCDKDCFDVERILDKSKSLSYEEAREIFHSTLRKSEYGA